MPNAAKRHHIAKFPIEDLFMSVLDTDLGDHPKPATCDHLKTGQR
jgi:hypothetical protein